VRASKLSETLDARLAQDAAAVDRRLAAWHASAKTVSPRLHEAVGYSLLGSGKRLRPILCLWSCDAAGGERNDAVWLAALSLEMVHAYSLIHDDLPAMDDDDLRRGRASSHVRFDEATAILAGDALQAEAMALLSRVEEPQLCADLIALIAQAIGMDGMAGGQQLDLASEDPKSTRQLDWDDLRQIHCSKTGRLLGAALAMGVRCAGLSREAVERAGEAGERAGEAFQIQDDVLDATATAAELGKSPGKDEAQRKLTAVRAFGGVEAARQKARDLLHESLDLLEGVGVTNAELRGLLTRFVDRSR